MSKQSYLDAAYRYSGMVEGSTEWNDFISYYNANSGYTYDGNWCAEFAAYIAMVSGNSSLFPLVNYSYGQYIQLYEAGATLYTPEQYTAEMVPGISFDYDTSAPGDTVPNHMGVVIAYDESTGLITTIEGNITVNGGTPQAYQATYNINNSRFRYFYTPPEWIGGDTPTPPTPGGGGTWKRHKLPVWIYQNSLRNSQRFRR